MIPSKEEIAVQGFRDFQLQIGCLHCTTNHSEILKSRNTAPVGSAPYFKNFKALIVDLIKMLVGRQDDKFDNNYWQLKQKAVKVK